MAPRQAGALLLILLTACASTTRYLPQGTSPDYTLETRWYEVEEVEPGGVATCPVPVDRGGFQRAVRQLAREVRWDAPPQEAARALLEAGLEEEWVAEVSRGRVLTLVPLEDKGPLVPVEEEALRGEYGGWCRTRGGGDCLNLYADGPYLRADDRRTLAFALAFGSVLDETREALVHEVLDPRAVLATLAWTGGMYLSMWLVPEPATKAVVAVLTLALMGWLGVDALWGLVDGWAKLAHRAHEARTFAELQAAGQEYAKAIGEHAARALVMAVAAVMGSKAAEVARRLRSLPGYARALVQAEAQGVPLGAVAEVEAVAASSEGGFSVLMRGRRGGGGAGSAAPGGPRGPSVTTVMRHRGGNLQVVLSNGQRWHLPRGKSPRDIPASDPLGDELQAAATRVANKWGPGRLTPGERAAIDEARRKGKYFQAARLEGQARGRWVEEQLRDQFKHLEWNRQGVDITGPNGSKYHYEVLAGTADNFGRHGRRMSDILFRMIFF
ncbi:hypothetical protein [Archangium sp.]|uniref:SitA5 family polymorphic toxin n=1 Tax=Archangium sp. TaxID=1872627 RepID=UPI002D367830|nr:hypothetical protein [Archangium sp.]HYO53860.1 hypothetical protein [Archangium sp.]